MSHHYNHYWRMLKKLRLIIEYPFSLNVKLQGFKLTYFSNKYRFICVEYSVDEEVVEPLVEGVW